MFFFHIVMLLCPAGIRSIYRPMRCWRIRPFVFSSKLRGEWHKLTVDGLSGTTIGGDLVYGKNIIIAAYCRACPAIDATVSRMPGMLGIGEQ